MVNQIGQKLKKREQLLAKLKQEYREKLRTAEASIAFSIYRMCLHHLPEEAQNVISSEYVKYIQEMKPKTRKLTIEYLHILFDETQSRFLQKVIEALSKNRENEGEKPEHEGENHEV